MKIGICIRIHTDVHTTTHTVLLGTKLNVYWTEAMTAKAYSPEFKHLTVLWSTCMTGIEKCQYDLVRCVSQAPSPAWLCKNVQSCGSHVTDVIGLNLDSFCNWIPRLSTLIANYVVALFLQRMCQILRLTTCLILKMCLYNFWTTRWLKAPVPSIIIHHLPMQYYLCITPKAGAALTSQLNREMSTEYVALQKLFSLV
jgi:hypothetical protein